MATSPTPRRAATAPRQPKEASQIGPEVQAAIAAAIAAVLTASAELAVLQAAGWSIQRLVRSVSLFLRPLATVRITILARYIEQQWNDVLPTSGPRPDIWDKIMRQEMAYERTFAKRSARRIALTMKRAAERGEDLDEAHRRALAREARFERMRQQAVLRRVSLKLEEEWVREQSPEGAYWEMDARKKTHTPDCLAMANKAWSWQVLAVISPSNRHNLCGCHLVPLPMARANGRPNSNMVRSSVPRVASASHR